MLPDSENITVYVSVLVFYMSWLSSRRRNVNLKLRGGVDLLFDFISWSLLSSLL